MNTPPAINFLRLRPDSDADMPLPCYMTPRAAGMDIRAAIETATSFLRGFLEGVKNIATPLQGIVDKVKEGAKALWDVRSPETFNKRLYGLYTMNRKLLI